MDCSARPLPQKASLLPPGPASAPSIYLQDKFRNSCTPPFVHPHLFHRPSFPIPFGSESLLGRIQ